MQFWGLSPAVDLVGAEAWVKSCAPIITMSIAEHVATLTNGTDEAKALAVQALLPLALHQGPAVVEAGAVAPLVELLRSGGMLNKLQAMNAFSILGMNANLNVWVACAEAGASGTAKDAD